MSHTVPATLLSAYQFGDLTLKNHLVMAPMTRSRALVEGNVPNPLAATYYAQRATAGLIISEATQVSPQGVGYIRTPGIHSPEQVEGWRKVTDAVHAASGLIFAQLWHVGRVSHADFHGGEPPVAPSAIAAEGEVFTWNGKVPLDTPRALETVEIPGIVEDFRKAAANAKAAGFDGVEIHGASGYLLDQFLQDNANQRSDRYGGSLENRARFALEVTAAAIEVFGAKRVGYKVTPNLPLHSMADGNKLATFTYLAQELDKLGIGYLHVGEAIAGPMAVPEGVERITPHLRKAFKGALIVNGGYDAKSGEQALVEDRADLVCYGVPFLTSPDLPERFRRGVAPNSPDFASFYGTPNGDALGYTDYPTL
ncbi:N-ethylmaleimide reductase [Pseudomonas flavescens]|uniref:N-ethylmaleimide reductase n=1 Tax=Phytopseudomonas flavescens TaxID=29435 RepID=A0A1G7YTS8_9GAMM|nr:alkene reductase [Pseudomonas flavescens]SDG99814.1 N-ethylmaleimide reductase [Pseudomonas flavescens]